MANETWYSMKAIHGKYKIVYGSFFLGEMEYRENP